MFLSRTITAPTCARRQVERSATWRVIVMKYWSHVGRLLIGVSRDDADRLGNESDHEHYQAQDGSHQPRGTDRRPVVVGRRVPERRHETQDDRPEEPPWPSPKPEPDENRHQDAAQRRRGATHGRIHDVPTVELADREE